MAWLGYAGIHPEIVWPIGDWGARVIDRASAVRYYGTVEQGRTGPLRVQVEVASGDLIDVILKATDHHHLPIEGLANEMLGSLLAGDLDLPTPRPFLVDISPAFIESIPDVEVRQRLSVACAMAFGSTDAGAQWRRWSPTDHLVADNVDLALRLFAFDAFIGNADRGPKNPNLLKNKSDAGLLLIDHENAFGIRMRLFPPLTPWVLGNLSALAARGADSEHLFYAPLEGRSDLAFDAIGQAWNGLSDVRFAAYDALLPDAWQDARPAVQDALGHFRAIRENLPGCIAELMRVLE